MAFSLNIAQTCAHVYGIQNFFNFYISYLSRTTKKRVSRNNAPDICNKHHAIGFVDKPKTSWRHKDIEV